MSLILDIQDAIDKAGDEDQFEAAYSILKAAEDGPERMMAIQYVALRLGLLPGPEDPPLPLTWGDR